MAVPTDAYGYTPELQQQTFGSFTFSERSLISDHLLQDVPDESRHSHTLRDGIERKVEPDSGNLPKGYRARTQALEHIRKESTTCACSNEGKRRLEEGDFLPRFRNQATTFAEFHHKIVEIFMLRLCWKHECFVSEVPKGDARSPCQRMLCGKRKLDRAAFSLMVFEACM